MVSASPCAEVGKRLMLLSPPFNVYTLLPSGVIAKRLGSGPTVIFCPIIVSEAVSIMVMVPPERSFT